MTPFKPEAVQAMEACRSHAQDLFDGATLLRDKSLPHLAYHLATLALEELGKAQLIGMKSFAKDDAGSWYGKQFDDHIKKLFWAIWGDVFGKRPDPKEIEQLRGTATIIHNNRLRGIYVEVATEHFIAPKDAVTDEMLAPLMNLVEAKLALRPSLQGVEYKQEDLELLSWFSGVNDDPHQRKFIFSRESFDKMAAVGPKEWLTWIRDEIEKSSTTTMAALQKEMARGFIEGEEGQQEKWELKIRLFSQSHSIRPKPLNQWNDKVTWIKLYPVNGKKHHLDAILKIPKFITIQAVYHVGYGYSNLLLAALNIASGGLFWWHEPKNLSTFYESLVDKENQMTGMIGRTPELKLGWPPAVLDEAILDQVISVFAMMPQPYEPSQISEAVGHYLAGIALLAKTDVFLQFEAQSYGAFLSAAKAALRLYRDDLGTEFPADISALLSFLTVDEAFKKKHSDLTAGYEARTVTPGSITLSEVAEMKRICEALFMHAFSKRIQSGAARERQDKAVSEH
jgi:AbiV family abortive infection protein